MVYVGNLHRDHKKWVLKIIEAGKPVLCEKPMAMSEAESFEMIEVAQRNQVLLTEAVWSRFNPVYSRLRQILESHQPAAACANMTIPITSARILRADHG